MGDTSGPVEPVVVRNSGRWLGNDGSWSTFYVNVGTPPQYFHVLPSFNGQTVYVPIEDDCARLNFTDCGALRGVEIFNSKPSLGFQRNASSTWNELGIYALENGRNFGLDGNALYGFDTAGVFLSNGAAENITLKNQTISAFATPDTWLGQLGLSPFAITVNETEKPRSLLSIMKDDNLIPSLSFGYQAGAAHRYTKVPSSLVLGGYDQSRRSNNTITIPASTDIAVGLQTISITTQNDTTTVIHPGILTVIDTAIPELWLPPAICDQIATTLNISYHNESQRYALTTSTHSALQTLDPTFRFKIGTDIRSDPAITIEIPYAAFDLEASYPLFASPTKYFPLRRAENSTQYALGRAFLQEVYIAVDWERDVFNISQAVFSAPMPEPHVVAVQPKIAHSTTTTTTTPDTGSGTELATGAVAGIVIGAVVLLAIVVLGVWGWRRKQRRENVGRYPGALQVLREAQGSEMHEAEGDEKKGAVELGRGNQRDADVELEGDRHCVVELHAPMKTHELSGDSEQRIETGVVYEMDGTSQNRP